MTENFQVFKIDNGLKYIHSELKSSNLVTVAIFFRLGSIWETSEFYGGSHFLEHFLFKGCDMFHNAKDLNMAFDNIGAIINAATSHEYTYFYGIVSKDKFEKFFNILSTMVMTPIFNPKEFEKEKNVVLEELKRYLDLPEVLSEEELYRIAFGDGHRLSRKIGGEVSDVTNIKLESLKQFYKKYYTPQNACISIAGNIELERVHNAVCKSKLAEDYTGIVTKIERNPISLKDGLQIYVKKPTNGQEQCYINIGFRTKTCSTINKYKIDFLSKILNCGMSSRLFQDLRENHGISYSQSAGYDCYIDAGIYVITTSVDCNSIYKTIINGIDSEGAIEILFNQIKLLKNELITQEELSKVKACSLAHLYLSYEKCSKCCIRYGEELILSEDGKITSIKDEEDIYKSMTPELIKKIANKIFDFDKCYISISGNINENELKTHINEKCL